jgi:hypothetical protein
MCLMCQGWSRAEMVAMLRDRILTYGYTIIDVGGDGPANPPYAYTAGLSRVDHPELIFFGAHPDCAYQALEAIARLVVREGRRFDEGSSLDDVYGPSGRGGQLLRFPDSSAHLIFANEFYRKAGGPPVPALQLLWPEREPLLNGSLATALKPWA